MAYKIMNAKFVNDKIKLDSFNLDSSNNLITQLETKNNEEKRLLTRIMKGKEQIKNGRFLIDNMDLVNPSFVKSRTTFIKGDNYLERFIPAKFKLVITTLLNPKFFRDARMVTITNKFNYYDFKNSNTNITVGRLKKELDKIINEYISRESREETDKLDEFKQRLLAFNVRKANELDELKDIVLKVVAKSYFDELVKLYDYNLMLQFLQALYDDVYNFMNLRNSCTCEYNVKNSSNKILKKSKKELSYQETKYVVLKQLKYLGIRITEFRFKIYRQNRLVDQLKKQLNIELIKRKEDDDHFNKAGVQSFLNDWKQLLDDQFDIFRHKQKTYLVNTLANKTFVVARTLVIYIHTYHQKVLSQNIEFGNKQDYKAQKNMMKEKLISVWKQAVDYNEKQLQEYDIKIDWFLKSTFKMSSLNIVFMNLLRSINLQKKNIVLTDFVKLLSYQDFQKLLMAIKKIKEKNPDFSFIMMQSQIEKFPYLNQPIYMFKNQEFLPISLKREIDNNAFFFRKELFNGYGIKYNYDNKRIIIDKRKYLWTKADLQKTGTFFVNPFSFELNFTEPFGNGKVNLLVTKKHANTFNDEDMYLAKANNGIRFYFYNDSQVEINKLNKVWTSFSLKEIIMED